MFCCAGLENAVKRAGERGIAIILEKQGDRVRFLIQSRGVAKVDEEKLAEFCKSKPELDLWINISAETGLKFCPWCGTRLQDVIDSHQKEYVRLSEQHNDLIKNKY
jgi:hypothetical protein